MFLNPFQGDHLTPIPFALPWRIPDYFSCTSSSAGTARGFCGQCCVCAVVAAGDRVSSGVAGEGCEGWELPGR